MVDEISKKLDFKDKNVVQIENNQLKLINGNLDEKPWIVIDEDENLYILEEANEYIKLKKELNDLVEENIKLIKENFEMKLEKAIIENSPRDFYDVKAVFLEKIKDINYKDIDIEKILKEIKKEHPNLFMKLSFENFLDILEVEL